MVVNTLDSGKGRINYRVLESVARLLYLHSVTLKRFMIGMAKILLCQSNHNTQDGIEKLSDVYMTTHVCNQIFAGTVTQLQYMTSFQCNYINIYLHVTSQIIFKNCPLHNTQLYHCITRGYNYQNIPFRIFCCALSFLL